MKTNGLAYRPEIDGIRAVAVLGVVLFHVGLSAVAGGFVGVDVFFVISGYLITSLLVAEAAAAGRVSLVEFYARRMRRLLPALVLVVAATVLAAAVLLSPVLHEVQDVAKAGVASIGLVSNILFYRETGGYFGGPAEHIPLLHIWSLSVEEQFYLVWPLLLALLLRIRPRAVPAAICAITVVSWLGALWFAYVRPDAAFFLTPYRAWEFGIGGLVATGRPRNLSPRARGLATLLGLAAVASALVTTPQGRWWFPAFGALAPVLGTGVLFVGIADGGLDTIPARLLRSRPVVAIGRLSYSWYLWHWPPLALYAALALNGGTLAGRAAIGVASFCAAALTLRVVEDPIRRRRVGPGWSARRTLTVGGTCAAIAVLLFTGVAYLAKAEAARPSELQSFLDARGQLGDRCDLDYKARALPPLDSICVSGASDANVVLLWGDSHALAWVPFAKAFADARHLGLVRMDADGCSPVLSNHIDAVDPRDPTRRRVCQQHNERVRALLSAATVRGHRIVAVIIARRWSTSVNGPYSALDRPQYDALSASVRAERVRSVTSFPDIVSSIPSTIEVVLMGPLPELRSSTAICLARRREADCAMPRVVYDSLRKAVLPVLSAAASHDRGAVVDPIGVFCDNLACPVRRHGLWLFFDDDHISSQAARSVAMQWLIAAAESLAAPVDRRR